MPTSNVKETSLYTPGNLVKCSKAIYSSNPRGRIAEGTVGTILKGPQKGYNEHCQVHFAGMSEAWWVHYHEIKPYILG